MITIDVVFDLFALLVGIIVVLIFLLILPLSMDSTVTATIENTANTLNSQTLGISYIRNFNSEDNTVESTNFRYLSTYYSMRSGDEWNFSWNDEKKTKSEIIQPVAFSTGNLKQSVAELDYGESTAEKKIVKNLSVEDIDVEVGGVSASMDTGYTGGFRLPIPTANGTVKSAYINAPDRAINDDQATQAGG